MRANSGGTWPIDPSAAKVPKGWPGWPEGKQFSFVITHDVEGPDGLAKCRQLAEIEIEAGFRSSFNFVPEGSYSVPSDLRHWLTGRGFEVGVHDLHHDGKLYESRSKFQENAARINHYVHEWGAKGFRSGFMLHELDWIHDLDILYDSSTFDTDPFEPQPDPAKTIFPFWVPSTSPDLSDGELPFRETRGYVELPYSLPQDSTLFSVFQESTPAIWLKKLDWIAENKGMALINVHPDYVGFPGDRTRKREFPVAHYITLLAHLKDKYNGRYWQPLPLEIAQWYKATHPPQSSLSAPAGTVSHLTKKRAAVLLYSYYPSDSRPRRAAEAMVEAGMDVDLLCLKENHNEPEHETIRGVNVFRTPISRVRGRRISYIWKYGRFFLTSFGWLMRRGLHRGYDVVHVHNMPDFLVFAAIPQKVLGSRVILDLHDPMPELMRSIYGLPEDHWQITVLRRLERMAIGFSDVTLTPNLTFKTLFASRSCAPDKVHIVMNSPEEDIFNAVDEDNEYDSARLPGEFRIMHHGSIVRRHGIDFLVRAIAAVRPTIPGLQLDIYGRREPFLSEVLKLAADLGVADIVHYHGGMTPVQIGKAIRRANLGVIPNRRSSFTETNFPTRIFEYLAMDRPVIAPATQGITDYFGKDELVLFKQDDLDDLVSKIQWVHSNPEDAAAIVKRGKVIYRRHLWTDEKAAFLKCVSDVL